MLFGLILVTASGCGNKEQGTSCGETCATCPSSTISAGGDCGCAMQTPINLALVNGTMWPFGVHGGGHPEGHRGWDFTATTALTISAPAPGTVVQFDNSVKDEDPLGVVTSFQPMRPDATIQVGSHVSQGQLTDGSTGAMCSTPFMPASAMAQLNAILASASYGEKIARTSSFACTNWPLSVRMQSTKRRLRCE